MKILLLLTSFVFLGGCITASPVNFDNVENYQSFLKQVTSKNKPLALSAKIKHIEGEPDWIITRSDYNDIGVMREAMDEVEAFAELCLRRGFDLSVREKNTNTDLLVCESERVEFALLSIVSKEYAGSDIGGYSYDRYMALFEPKDTNVEATSLLSSLMSVNKVFETEIVEDGGSLNFKAVDEGFFQKALGK